MTDSGHDRLVKNIGLWFSLFFVSHGLIFTAVAVYYVVPLWNSVVFFIALFVYHFVLAISMIRAAYLFVYTQTGKAIESMNIALVITFVRLTSLPSIVALILLLREFPVLGILVAYIILSFITDFLDGSISRRMKQTSIIGAYLDSVSDYLLLLALSLAYIVFGLLPIWFFALVLLRLIFQWLAATIIVLINKKIVSHRSSLLAKSCIASIMLTYAAALLQFLPVFSGLYPTIITVMKWVTVPLVVLSLIEKGIIFVRDLQGYWALRKSGSAKPEA